MIESFTTIYWPPNESHFQIDYSFLKLVAKMMYEVELDGHH